MRGGAIIKDPILQLLIDLYKHSFLTRKFRGDQIDLWTKEHKILVRDKEDNPDEQAEDETLNHELVFKQWYIDDDGPLDEYDFCDLRDWEYNGGALFSKDGGEPEYIEGDTLHFKIICFIEWYEVMRSPYWAPYLKKVGY